MELSKGLQQEIQLVQSKLKNAIRDHQICVGKLKDDPNNADLLGRIQEIQLHIVSLGRCQKQVVQRLRKEVEAFKAENTNEVKVSVASLLGLNNNNHITADNEATADEISEVKVVTNGLDNVRLADAKEDYEEIVRNGDVPTPTRGNRKKKRSLSVETLSAEDDVIEVAIDEDSREKRRQEPEDLTDERKVNVVQQLNFLEVLGLITTIRFTELQNKRAERKRRSTANPQFVYSNWELPTKRKRHNYLQSACNVPQTRQTTARLNGPSPPPSNNKASSASAPTGPPPKSTSPPGRTIAKSLIPTQKATTRPNILRNMSESRVFPTKGRTENGTGQMQLSSGGKNSQQSVGKTVHIPGLPPSLTIERIENDTAVCINCRNPGTLTNCENCEANYHVSCHIISPAPPRLCPKCALKIKDETGTKTTTTTMTTTTTIKKNEELVAASYAPGVAGKAGEDPEVHKASCGFYKVGTVTKQQQQQHHHHNQQHQHQQLQQQQQLVSSGRGSINKLPSSAYLIPISSNALAVATGVDQSDGIVTAVTDPTIDVDKSNSNNTPVGTVANNNDVSYNASYIINHQLSNAGITYVQQSEPQASYAYKFPVNGNETEQLQSYYIVKKITESGMQNDGQQATEIKGTSVVNYQQLATTSGYVVSRGDESGCGTGGQQSEVAITNAPLLFDNLTGRVSESVTRSWKKSTTRAVPGLNRIVHTDNKSITVATEHADNNDLDKLQSGTYNGRQSTVREQQQLVVDQLRTIGRTEMLRGTRDLNESGKQFEHLEISGRNKSEHQQKSLFSRGKYSSKPGGLFHSLFSGYNKPDSVTDRSDDSQQSEESATTTTTIDGRNSIPSLKENVKPGIELSGNTTAERSHCSNIAPSTEHVKLEEAHLSAPLRAKLVCDDNLMVISECEKSSRLETTGQVVPNRRRTTEDRVRTSPFFKGFEADSLIADSRQDRSKQLSRMLLKTDRKSLDSRTMDNSFVNSSRPGALDFTNFEEKYGTSFDRVVPYDDLPECSDHDSDTTSADEVVSLIDTSDQVPAVGTVENKKFDAENKDLTSEDLVEIDVNDVDDVDDVDNEEVEADDDDFEEDEDEEDDEEDEDEDEEEEEDQEDSPIVDDEEIIDEANASLGMSVVSRESMQVLEQFESAMLEVDSGDTTANP